MPAATTLVDVAEGVSDVLEALSSWTRRQISSSGLSLSAATTLLRISRAEVRGVSALAAVEGVTQPAMSQMLGRLERDGLVARSPEPGDARSTRVELTARGQQVVDERRAARTRALSRLLQSAPPADTELIAAALPALGRLTSHTTTVQPGVMTS